MASPPLHDRPLATQRILERIALFELALQSQIEELDRKLDGQLREVERMAASLQPTLFRQSPLEDIFPLAMLSGVVSCLVTCLFAAAFL